MMRLVLDGVHYAVNIGQLFRSALAFHTDAVVLVGCSARIYSDQYKKVFRSSRGGANKLPVIKFEEGSDYLESLNGWPVIAIENRNNPTPINHITWPEDCDIVVGGEDRGVSEGILNTARTIAIIPHDNSIMRCLNVSVAGAIALQHHHQSSLKNRFYQPPKETFLDSH